MASKLDLDIDGSQARSELQAIRADIAAAKAELLQLKSALSDASGMSRQMVQGAITGVSARIGRLNTALESAMGSSTALGGGMGGAGGTTIPPGGIGTFNFGAGGFGQMGVGPVGVSGVMPMNPGTTQGQFGASGYTPTMRFAPGTQPGIAAQPTVMMGLPPFGSASATTVMGTMPPQPAPYTGQTIFFNPQQAQQAAYGTPPTGPLTLNRYGVAMVGQAAASAAQFAEGAINYQTARIRTGGVDFMAQGGNTGQGIGSLAGGAIGGIIGSAFGPLGTMAGVGIGAGIGGGLGRSIGEFLNAGRQNVADANASITDFFSSRYGFSGINEMHRFTQGESRINPFAFGPSTLTSDSRLDRIVSAVNKRFGGTGLQTELPDVAKTFGAVAGTLFNFGTDPFGAGEPDVRSQTFATEARRRHDESVTILREGLAGTGRGSSLIGGLAAGAMSDIAGIQAGKLTETIGETYTRRLGLLFGKDSTDAAKRIGPGFDPFLGGNTADILGQLGASDTLAYLRIHDKNLNSSVDPELLSRVAGTSRTNARTIALGSLLPTGSARAQALGFAAEGDNLAQLPGGTDGLAYSKAYAGFRAVRFEAFGQETLSGFGMRDLALHGEQQRQQYMPFSPGSIFATSLGIIANNRTQIGRLQGFMQNSDLSETERYGMESQRQGLMAENARNVGMLSEGFENKLPALAAGRPGFFGRYNSEMGASINLGRYGSPIRAYGAFGGAQRAAQESFVHALGGDTVPGAMHPMSRTQDLNTTNDILNRILQAITANGGHQPQVAHPRPTDNNGAYVGPQNKDIGYQQRVAWNSH